MLWIYYLVVITFFTTVTAAVFLAATARLYTAVTVISLGFSALVVLTMAHMATGGVLP
jgi:hypothetical protein